MLVVVVRVRGKCKGARVVLRESPAINARPGVFLPRCFWSRSVAHHYFHGVTLLPCFSRKSGPSGANRPRNTRLAAACGYAAVDELRLLLSISQNPDGDAFASFRARTIRGDFAASHADKSRLARQWLQGSTPLTQVGSMHE